MVVIFRFEVYGREKVAFDFVAEEDGAAAARHLRLGEEVGHFSREREGSVAVSVAAREKRRKLIDSVIGKQSLKSK